jgi:hypothetical protein
MPVPPKTEHSFLTGPIRVSATIPRGFADLADILVARALPADLIATSKIGINFCANPKSDNRARHGLQ